VESLSVFDLRIPVKRFAVEEYHRLIAADLLGEDDHVELLEGVIVEMTPQGRPHALLLSELNRRFAPSVGPSYSVRIQLPLTLQESEPEPDFAIVSREEELKAADHPRTALLIIEVADSSLAKDRVVKSRIYAHANVTEYWIARPKARSVEVLRGPDATTGSYGSMETVGLNRVLSPVAFPSISIPVTELFASLNSESGA
jgi:Uma2 family endonuclease